MTKHLIHFLPLLLCLLFGGCSNRTPQYPQSLLVADSLAMCNPDSAVTLLSELAPQMASAPEPVRHYYELLTIKARDKAFLPFESDSLVLATLDYYENGGDVQHLPEAYYYMGRYLSDLGDAPQALEYFQKAIDVIESESYSQFKKRYFFKSNKLLGLLYAQSGYLFMKQHLYENARSQLQRAYYVDSINQDTFGMAASLRDIGQISHLQNDFEKAINYYKQCECLSTQYNDSFTLFKAQYQEIHTLVAQNRIEEARSLFHKQKFNQAFFTNPTYCSIIGNMFSAANEADSAKVYFAKSINNGSLVQKAHAHIWFANEANKKGEVQTAIDHIKEYIELTNTINDRQESETTALTSSLYNYNLREKENAALKLKESQMQTHIYMVVSFAVLLLFLTYYLYILNKRSRLQCENLRYIIAANNLDKERRQEITTSAIARIKKSPTYRIITDKEESKLPLTENEWKTVEQTFMNEMPEFLSRLHAVYDFSVIEWRITLLVKLGIAPATISTLVNRSISSVTLSRRRLYKKVIRKEGTAKDWDEFIRSL